ncbi:MAG: iron-sulfur cluster assembly scaffold protein [archaeon]|jgi:nitrogen fixation NifU-like protein|nr:iron-sulfur cluster assembly scaffold protein [archaeon]
MYSEKVMDLFRHPKNIGEIKDADAVGKVGNPTCGDLMWVYLKVGKNKTGEEVIDDIKVKTFGCVAAIATSSALTEIVKGMKLAEAEKITRENVADYVGGLPPAKLHCSVLAVDGLQKAIEEYKKKKKK